MLFLSEPSLDAIHSLHVTHQTPCCQYAQKAYLESLIYLLHNHFNSVSFVFLQLQSPCVTLLFTTFLRSQRSPNVLVNVPAEAPLRSVSLASNANEFTPTTLRRYFIVFQIQLLVSTVNVSNVNGCQVWTVDTSVLQDDAA